MRSLRPSQVIVSALRFAERSFSRLFASRWRRVLFVIMLVGGAVLYLGVISDSQPRSSRLVFAGAVFVVCLVGSFLFGLPAGVISAAANAGGAGITFSIYAATVEWYYLSVAVFQTTTLIASLVIAIVADLEREEKERHVRASLTDPLTELYNARFFRQRLAEEIERCTRYGLEAAVLSVDLDAFKTINDEFGHATGDQVLHDTARYLKHALRISDIVFRQGGDEFAVILPQTSRAIASRIATRIQKNYPTYMSGNAELPKGVVFGLSVGIASCSATGEIEVLLREADESLYRDKRNRGRSRTS